MVIVLVVIIVVQTYKIGFRVYWSRSADGDVY